MPEFRIGKYFSIRFGSSKDTAVQPSSSKLQQWVAWQTEKEPVIQEALRDPEVYAVKQSCTYNCGWWKAAVSAKNQPDIANASIIVDFGRHLYYDCPNIPKAEKRQKKQNYRQIT